VNQTNSFITISARDMKALGIEYGVALSAELAETLMVVSVLERKQFLVAMFSTLIGQVAHQLGPELTLEMLEYLAEITPNACKMTGDGK
jgi:hypothetical protein